MVPAHPSQGLTTRSAHMTSWRHKPRSMLFWNIGDICPWSRLCIQVAPREVRGHLRPRRDRRSNNSKELNLMNSIQLRRRLKKSHMRCSWGTHSNHKNLILRGWLNSLNWLTNSLHMIVSSFSRCSRSSIWRSWISLSYRRRMALTRNSWSSITSGPS